MRWFFSPSVSILMIPNVPVYGSFQHMRNSDEPTRSEKPGLAPLGIFLERTYIFGAAPVAASRSDGSAARQEFAPDHVVMAARQEGGRGVRRVHSS